MNKKMMASLLFLIFFARILFSAEEFLGQNVLRSGEVENKRLQKYSPMQLEEGFIKGKFTAFDFRNFSQEEKYNKLFEIARCSNSCPLTLKTLLAARADVNYQDENNNTPIHLGILFGSNDFIITLLEQDANPSLSNLFGRRPIHNLVEILNDDRGPWRLSTLLQYDADLFAETPKGDTVLSLIGHSQKIKERIQILISRKITENKIFLACQTYNLHMISRLIAENVDLNQVDAKGYTPLMCAAGIGEQQPFGDKSGGYKAIGIIKKLLDAQADPQTRADDGTTLLAVVANSRCERVIKSSLLLEIRNFILAKKRGIIFGLLKWILVSDLKNRERIAKLILELDGTYNLGGCT